MRVASNVRATNWSFLPGQRDLRRKTRRMRSFRASVMIGTCSWCGLPLPGRTPAGRLLETKHSHSGTSVVSLCSTSGSCGTRLPGPTFHSSPLTCQHMHMRGALRSERKENIGAARHDTEQNEVEIHFTQPGRMGHNGDAARRRFEPVFPNLPKNFLSLFDRDIGFKSKFATSEVCGSHKSESRMMLGE